MTSQPYPNRIRHFSLSDEVEIGAKLVRHGLRALQDDSVYRDFLHLPILLLANGSERLLKTIICFHTIAEQGVFPTNNDIKTHDVSDLLCRVVESCYTPTYLIRSEARDDLEFLTRDSILLEVIEALSAFGKTERYFNLDVVVGERGGMSLPAR